MLGIPLMMASADPSASAPLFGCLELENIVVLGVSSLAAQRAEWGPETLACYIEVDLEHPDAIMTAMGMPSSPSDATEAHPYLLEPYCRMTDVGKVAFLVSLQAEIDSNSSAERDIVDALPESEVACIREALSDEEFQMLLGSTVHEAFNASDALASCITDEGYVDIFAAIRITRAAG